jgi:hypothetical protein
MLRIAAQFQLLVLKNFRRPELATYNMGRRHTSQLDATAFTALAHGSHENGLPNRDQFWKFGRASLRAAKSYMSVNFTARFPN